MHKLRKFFYQNKYQILSFLLIIIFIFIIIQLINLWIRKNNNVELINKQQSTTTVNENNPGVISEKSAVTGQEVPKQQLDNETTAINTFMEYCNKQDF